MSGGQVISQVCAVMVAVAVKELSVLNNSLVVLDTVAVLETPAPSAALESTWKMNCRTAVVLAGRVAIVQVELPVLPGVGFVQVKAGPDVCVSETNVELVATVTVS